MLKTLDRYLLRRFLWLLAATLFCCIFLFVFLDFIGNLSRYLNASLRYAFLYYFYLAPYITVMVFPIAMLLSAMFTVGVLAMHQEIAAMRSAGISILRITAPLFVLSAFLCVGVLAVSETILPEFHRRKTFVLEYRLGNREPPNRNVKRNFYYHGKNEVMYRFNVFHGKKKRAEHVLVEKYRNDRLISRIRSDSLVWKDGMWTFWNGVEMDFQKDMPSARAFAVFEDADLKDRPEDFLVSPKTPDDMSMFELRTYIDQVRRAGGKAHKYMADYHFKMSYPLINFVVVLLGIGLTTRVGKRGLARVFGVGLAICFIYYLFAKLGLAFGHSGDLQPFLAAWIGNFVFSLLGVTLFWRATR